MTKDELLSISNNSDGEPMQFNNSSDKCVSHIFVFPALIILNCVYLICYLFLKSPKIWLVPADLQNTIISILSFTSFSVIKTQVDPQVLQGVSLVKMASIRFLTYSPAMPTLAAGSANVSSQFNCSVHSTSKLYASHSPKH